jgi:hypothetical protein
MRIRITLFALLLNTYVFTDSTAQQLPLVYDVENTGADCPIPYLPAINELPSIPSLPDPFEWADGRGRMAHFSDWRYRRAEISAQIQNYEIGVKPPRPDTITASFSRSDSILRVIVTVNGKSLTLTSKVYLPAGTGPFPAIIGVGFSFPGLTIGSLPDSIFSNRNIARIIYNHDQVTSYGSPSNGDPYYQLYPALNLTNTGQYSAWAWGVSRLIDGLELVQDSLPIDLSHLAVTGCSYAGKLALFAGAFDERIALTMAIESGGGGYTTWRFSETLGNVETLEATNYTWFKDAMKDFSGQVSKLPEDHHELMAMVAPRALLVTGNPGWVWLADESGYVGSNAAKKVWEALGVPDRLGYSLIGGHDHCAVPSGQFEQIDAFVNKFLLGDTTANTNVATAPYATDLTPWITWTNPTLTSGTSFFGKAALAYPANFQKGLDTIVTLRWNKINSAHKYLILFSTDPTFTNSVVRDSTTTDTAKTFSGLIPGKRYYWRVQVDSAGSRGPWSSMWNFSTYISLPPAPELVSAGPLYPDRTDYAVLKWKPALYADQYAVQVSQESTFAYPFLSITTTDTFRVVSSLSAGVTYYWRAQAENVSGFGPWSDSSFIITATGVSKEEVPTEYSISQNYPNPFNPSARIKFALPKAALTTIVLYDVLGREIRTLINKELGVGYYEVTVDASTLPSGTYFYRIQSGDFIQTKKMVLAK